MAKVMIKPLDPEFRNTLYEILSDSRYMPHFKDLIKMKEDMHTEIEILMKVQITQVKRLMKKGRSIHMKKMVQEEEKWKY
ncbi:hypothetical protein Dsin_012202 [Dipteronia sinensis]|uniref:Uncharacterized protein n=1 Tax=Dipteronia sinensis TaxID=43782 RepID=A0AAE0AIY2_9ROSI|nr:hypothetical protein Dsin_012202 [Dipteronia sinensis]